MSLFSTPLESLSLRQLLAGADFGGTEDIRVQSCSADSRTCRPGDLFVALDSPHGETPGFVHEAVARGACGVVSQQRFQVSVPVCLVSNAREALGQICQALAGDPSRRLRLIGITGTNGKTTTTHLIASMLQAAGHRTGLLGTLGYHDTAESAPADLTTPDAVALAEWLGRMVANNCSHAVMEVSSHALAQRRIAGVEFARVGLTNLRRDHLDFHGTLAAYHHAKTQLFNYLSSGGVAVINVDDPPSVENVPLIPGGVLTIGMHRPADVSATLVERCKSEQTFLLTAGDHTVPVRTAMIGDHHIYNCLLAAAIGLSEGLELTAIVRGLEAVTHVPGRLERIECGQPFGVYIDFAHTPDALAVSLATLREVTPGRILCVFGAGGNRDTKKRPLMGRTVETGADVAIITNDNPRFEDPQTIASEILAGFERPALARWMPDRAEAIQYALSLAGPDDCVLVAGKGHEVHQIVGHHRIPLDDRDLARRYLYNLEPASPYGSLMTVANS